MTTTKKGKSTLELLYVNGKEDLGLGIIPVVLHDPKGIDMEEVYNVVENDDNLFFHPTLEPSNTVVYCFRPAALSAEEFIFSEIQNEVIARMQISSYAYGSADPMDLMELSKRINSFVPWYQRERKEVV